MVVFLNTVSTNIATKVFKTDTPLLSAVPRTKFLFYTQFILSNEAATMMNNADLNTWQGQRGLSFKVKSIDKPKVTLETKELNQYNKKKLVYTNLTYGETSVRLHDTVDDSVLAFWVDYFTYFFADSRSSIGAGGDLSSASKSSGFRQSPIADKFVDNTGWGFRPLSEQTQFFIAIRIWAVFNQTYTRYSYINPRITSIDFQNHDSSSSDNEEISISFKYEALQYETFGQPLTNTDLEQLGFDPADSPTMTIPRQQPRLFNNSVINRFKNTGDSTSTRPPSNFSDDPSFSLTTATTQTDSADPLVGRVIGNSRVSDPRIITTGGIQFDATSPLDGRVLGTSSFTNASINNLNTVGGVVTGLTSSLTSSIGQIPLFGS